MARKAEEVIGNPEVQKALDLIARAMGMSIGETVRVGFGSGKDYETMGYYLLEVTRLDRSDIEAIARGGENQIKGKILKYDHHDGEVTESVEDLDEFKKKHIDKSDDDWGIKL